MTDKPKISKKRLSEEALKEKNFANMSRWRRFGRRIKCRWRGEHLPVKVKAPHGVGLDNPDGTGQVIMMCLCGRYFGSQAPASKAAKK